MSFKLDDLETFKIHRNKVSESLTNKFVGREKETSELCDLLSSYDFIAITGSAGIGKSCLAVATIEKYVLEHKNVTVLCVKSFGDYVSAIEESIEGSKEYLFLIDDANNYKKLDELIDCLKYHNQGNVKAIFTIRDYLKGCIDNKVEFIYEIGFLSDEDIKKAIKENTPIRNVEWLNKIANISKGNMRFAFVIAEVALKDEKGFVSLFDVKDIMNAFYKDQITKMNNSDHLIITAGIISFFKSVYLNQLFYISPILKIIGLTKQEFLLDTDVLLSMELLDECVGVVKLSDQCFADFLLYYVFIEKKYIRIKDLIVQTYKYYKKRIIESLNSILSMSLTEEVVAYVKKEAFEACKLIEDIELKHDIEVAFAPLDLDYAVMEFKKGVEDYSEKKDIEWCLRLFKILAKSKYCKVAIEGILILLKKTNEKKEDIYKVIDEAFILDYESLKNSFKYLALFVDYLNDRSIFDVHFLPLVSSYLKYSFRNSKFINVGKLEFVSFNITDDINGIIPFRRKCWDYIFHYGVNVALDTIIEFAQSHIAQNEQGIVSSDLDAINFHLQGLEEKELIQAVLYEVLKVDAKKFDFEEKIYSSQIYSELLHVLLERKSIGQKSETFKIHHVEHVNDFYRKYKMKIFEMITGIKPIAKYYLENIKDLLLIILDSLSEFPKVVVDIFIEYKIYPVFVIEKASTITNLNDLYEMIKNIHDTSLRDEYLYTFYSFINDLDDNYKFEFDNWIKLKDDCNVTVSFPRNAFSFRKIAENSNISYLKLIKIIFKKREYNAILAKTYLSYLFYKNETFKEILDLDKDLAIEIYEFLIEQGENDYSNRVLNEIIKVKKNYIKEFAKRYVEKGIVDEEGIEEIIFDGNNYKPFFNTCIEVGKTKQGYFIPFALQRFISCNLDRQEMINWIIDYIDKNRNDDESMESLFSILAGIDDNYRNSFIVKYYEKGKNEKVLRCALLGTCESYSVASAESYFNAKIRGLESLKSDLVKWTNLNLISFINELIEEYNNEIITNKISQLVEHVDTDLMTTLREIDLKTEVSLGDAFKLYCEDEKFRKVISSGYVEYKEGCFVSNSNVPIKFKDVLSNKRILGIKMVQTNESEQVKYEKYLSSMKIIENRFNNENIVTLDECLIKLFDERSWSLDDFERETSLSRDIFSKIKNNKRNKLQKVTLIKILIGLKLLKPERDFLLELNNTQLSKYDVNDVLYSFILDSKIDIDMADDLLKSLGKEGFIKEF